MKNQPSTGNLHLILFMLGVSAGILLTLLSTWADLESSYYGFDRTGGARLSTLSCPMLMTHTETNAISIRIENDTEKKVSPAIKVDISSPLAPVSSIEEAILEPGETKRLSWQISSQNIDLGRFIFARVWTYAAYPLRDREATCGVFVLSLPGRGIFYTGGLILVSLLGMGYGLMGMRQQKGPVRSADFERASFLALVTTLGLFVSYMGWWLAGVLVIVLAFLVIVISIGYSIRP